MNTAQRIASLRSSIPPHVQLVCVSKFQSEELIMEAYQSGERHFGESRVQELCRKYESLPKDIKWHFIGHLQSNKIKYILPFVHLIHAVDSERLLLAIDDQGRKLGRCVDCLLQLHIAQETSKFGFTQEEVLALFAENKIFVMENLRIRGLMGMATLTEDIGQIREEMRALKQFFDTLKSEYFKDKNYFSELSMGMSDDYPIALEEGATIIRIGSSIFGERQY